VPFFAKLHAGQICGSGLAVALSAATQRIREQVIALTGQRYLDGYTSDEAQFKALMDQGITFGKQYALKSGVALTPEQMALLTGDIVWLVNTTVKCRTARCRACWCRRSTPKLNPATSTAPAR
jgi:large exoprotein involved in heme utilization and adhesion